jgi:hypothetical protein
LSSHHQHNVPHSGPVCTHTHTHTHTIPPNKFTLLYFSVFWFINFVHFVSVR